MPVASQDMEDTREKEFTKAMRQLTPIFVRKLPAKDVAHDLYGTNQLTLTEYELIGEVDSPVCLSHIQVSCIPGPIISI